MNYKTIFFILLSLTVTNVKCEQPEISESNFNKLKVWITQDKKHALIATTIILGPIAATYGYFFPPEAILDLISKISYKTAMTSGEIAMHGADGFVDGLVDSAYNNPATLAKIAALGLTYKTIFVGIPFVLTQLINFMLKVK